MTHIASLFENLFGAFFDHVLVGKEHTRVKVALDTPATTQASMFASSLDSVTTIRHVNGPIQRNHVDTSARHALNQGPRMLNVDDSRDIRVSSFDLIQDLLLIRGRKFVVVTRGQMASPRVENLDKLGPILNLKEGVITDIISQLLQDRMKQFRFIHGHLFNLQVFLGGLAFHQVGGQSVRAANKTQDGRFRSDLFTEHTQSLCHKRHGLVGIHGVNLKVV